MNTKTLISVAGSLCALFLQPQIAVAQSESRAITIVGKVIDSLKRWPIDYLIVVLKDGQQRVVATEHSKKDGSFSFSNLKHSKYTLTFARLGYRLKVVDSHLSDSSKSTYDLGQVLITPVVENLNEVTIEGTKPLIKQDIDRLTYNLQADPESKTISLLEMMRKVPMLSLDADDNVQLKGSSNYKILINGKPSGIMERSPKEVLRSIPASTIDRIEVITTPPSKYDAEGLTGIINIITIKNITNGHSGALNLYNTMPVGGPGTGGSISVKQGKLGLTAFGGGGIYNNPQTIDEVNRKSLTTTTSNLIQNNRREKDSHSGYLGTELSYEIDSLNLLSVEFNINGSKSKVMSIHQSILNAEAATAQRYHLSNNNDGRGNGWDLALNYQLGFKRNKSRLMTFSYRLNAHDYSEYSDLEISDQLNYSLPNYNQVNMGSTAESTFQIDFIQTVKRLSIEAGVKGIFRRNESDYQYRSINEISGDYELDPTRSNAFNNTQNVFAAYHTYQFTLKNWGFKLGLRLEKTLIEADFISTATKISQDQFNLVPAVVISKKFNNKSTLNLGYTQRIQRPGIYQLNPFVDRSNPNVQFSGNPNLRPVIANAVQLGYSIQGTAFIHINLDYTSFDALINQVAEYDPENNITRIAYQNTGKASMLGTGLSINYPATKFLTLNVNAKAALARVEGISNGLHLSTEGLMYSFSLSPGYNFGQGWRANGNLNIRSKSFSLQRETNAYISSSLSVSKELVKKKLTLSSSINNPFSKFRNSMVNLTGPGFEQISIDRLYSRSYRMSLNYNFGKLREPIQKNKRGIKNDDVSN
jgi:ferric enterobactin receptor